MRGQRTTRETREETARRIAEARRALDAAHENIGDAKIEIEAAVKKSAVAQRIAEVAETDRGRRDANLLYEQALLQERRVFDAHREALDRREKAYVYAMAVMSAAYLSATFDAWLYGTI